METADFFLDPGADTPEPKEKWTVYIGCHRRTLTSRDTHVEERSSLDECRAYVGEMERNYTSSGYYVWFAHAIGPRGEKITLHPGTPYN